MIEPAKRAVRQKITEVFNDADKGERPVLRRVDALFPPDSVAWKVNGDVTTMMIGGVSGLLPPLEAPRVDAEGKKIPPKDRGRAKKRLMSVRAIEALKAWRDAAG